MTEDELLDRVAEIARAMVNGPRIVLVGGLAHRLYLRNLPAEVVAREPVLALGRATRDIDVATDDVGKVLRWIEGGSTSGRRRRPNRYLQGEQEIDVLSLDPHDGGLRIQLFDDELVAQQLDRATSILVPSPAALLRLKARAIGGRSEPRDLVDVGLLAVADSRAGWHIRVEIQHGLASGRWTQVDVRVLDTTFGSPLADGPVQFANAFRGTSIEDDEALRVLAHDAVERLIRGL